MSQLSRISKWQCLFRYFEGAVWEHDVGSFRTESLLGNPAYRLEIQRSLASEISRLQDDINQHWEMHARSHSRQKYLPQTQTQQVNQRELEEQIASLLGENTPTVIQSPTVISSSGGSVPPSQIELIEVSDDSVVKGTVFPRSFRCPRCGHYEIINPNSVPDLTCKCCSGWCKSCNKKSDSPHAQKCEVCGESLTRPSLRQLPLVYACPRCANIEEFTPHLINLNQIAEGPIPCPQCNRGHLHLILGESLATATWRCSDLQCNFSEHLSKHCKCHIPDADGQPGIPSVMKPTTISASIATPLVHSYLWLGTDHVNFANLTRHFEQTCQDDPYAWRMSKAFENVELEMIRKMYGINEVFTIPKIQTTTIVYGYRSGISSYPHQIPDGERLAHLFTDSRAHAKYRAFLADTVGRGLVIELSKDKIIQALTNRGALDKDATYDVEAEKCCSFISSGNFQDVLSKQGPTAIAELLHAYEHAIFKNAVNQVGLEIFGSKILIKDAAIVLYEREEVGPGGLVQLTKTDQFLRLLQRIRNALWDCPQDCDGACLACSYINDYYCQPYMPAEVERWIPPNALINRFYAQELVRQVPLSNRGGAN